MGFSKNPLLDPKFQDGWDLQSWKSTWHHFSAEGTWSDLDKISHTGAEWHVDCGDMVNFETRCRIPIRRTFERIPWPIIPEPPARLQGAVTGGFNGMSSQSHISHCRVLPLGEFTVMIPKPHATLQGAVTWRNQCHDCAPSHGVIIPSAVFKIVFRHIFYYFFNAVWALKSGGFRIVSDTLVILWWINITIISYVPIIEWGFSVWVCFFLFYHLLFQPSE